MSSSKEKSPQFVSTVAVIFSPGATFSFGGFSFTGLGSAGATSSQVSSADAVVVSGSSSSPPQAASHRPPAASSTAAASLGVRGLGVTIAAG